MIHQIKKTSDQKERILRRGSSGFAQVFGRYTSTILSFSPTGKQSFSLPVGFLQPFNFLQKEQEDGGFRFERCRTADRCPVLRVQRKLE